MADSNGYFYQNCNGFRSNAEIATLTTLKVHDTVKFTAGFKQFASATAVATVTSAVWKEDYSYTVLDSAVSMAMAAASAAIMLTVL